MAEVKLYWQNYIDGAWVDGGADSIEVTDPATGKRIANHALADAADVDRAAKAARRVHLSGALTAIRPIERGRKVLSFREDAQTIEFANGTDYRLAAGVFTADPAERITP